MYFNYFYLYFFGWVGVVVSWRLTTSRRKLPEFVDRLILSTHNTSMPQLRALYHWIPLVELSQMSYLPTVADLWLRSYHPFEPADCYRYATASGLIPFDSSRLADSNGPPPDLIRRLAVELSSSLYFCSQGRYLQIVWCRVLQACHSFEPYTIEFLSSSWITWAISRPWRTSAWQAITFFNLLAATGMPRVRALYYLILLVRQIQMVRLTTRSGTWLRSYLLLCIPVSPAYTSRVFSAIGYKHTPALCHILVVIHTFL